LQQVGSYVGYTGGDVDMLGEAAYGPRLPTCALQQDGSYLRYSGHQINVAVTAARDPKQNWG
jgi:hypothetical protein